MKFLPVLHQNLNKPELCAFYSALSQTPVTQTLKHQLIFAEQLF